MSIRLSYPERTNLYLTNLNNKSKIEVLIPDGVLKCENHEDFYINVIQFNTFNSFYHVLEGYNNNFKIIIDDSLNIACSIPIGNINTYTIRDYINNHIILKNQINKIPQIKKYEIINYNGTIIFVRLYGFSIHLIYSFCSHR